MKKCIRVLIPVLLALVMFVTPLFSNVTAIGGANVVYGEEIAAAEDGQESDGNVESDIISDSGDETVTDEDAAENIEDSSEEETTEEESETTSEETANALETAEDDTSILNDNGETDSATELQAVDPQKVGEVVQNFADALVGIGVDAADADLFKGIMGGIGGASSIAAGVVGILKLIGVIEDPTAKAYERILGRLEQQNIAITEMSNKVNNIAAELINVNANQRLRDRANTAIQYTGFWQNYNSNYLEVMQTNISRYKSWVYKEIKAWSYDEEPESLYAYYTTENNVKTQTYAYKKDMSMELKVSDSGDTIVLENTIGLPGEYIKDAFKEYRDQENWNATTFRTDLKDLLANAVTKAMTEGKLGCSDTFKNTWNAADEAKKKEIAKEVANDLLNEAVYISSCKGVRKNSESVSTMLEKMNDTWNKANSSKSGIAGLIAPLKNTYCFEGEIKDEINVSYYYLTAVLTVYSLFAMTIASQSDMVSEATKERTRDDWINGSLSLKKGKTVATTGYDNFCYLNNQLVTFKKYQFYSEFRLTTGEGPRGVKIYDDDFRENKKWILRTTDNYKVIGKDEVSIVGSENAVVLYKTWQQNRRGTETFVQYLNRCNTETPTDYTGSLMTSYGGAMDFATSEGIRMKARGIFRLKDNYHHAPYLFKENNIYSVMTSSPSGSQWSGSKTGDISCVKIHDKVVGDTLDTTTGQLDPNVVLAARAGYLEKHWDWMDDEPWFFHTESCEGALCWNFENPGDKTDFGCEVRRYVYVLECSNLPKANNATVASDLSEDEDIEFAEDEFDPRNCTEAGEEEIIDTNYYANTDAEILSLDGWKKLDLNYLYLPESEEELTEGISEIIEYRIAEEAEKGNDVSLSDTEKKELESKIEEMLKAAEKEMSENDNMGTDAFLDPFGIYGNDTVTEKLAKSVLPDNQIATDGQTMQPVKNMITAAFYEPYVYLKCEKSGDGYALTPVLAYDVKPELLVWNDDIKQADSYYISDEVMKDLGLSMTVRLDASEAGDNDIANIIHYDDVDDMNVLETLTAKIQGSGADRYVEVTVSECSPFSITFSKGGAVNTGDSSNMTLYIIITVIAGMSLALAAIVVVRRRKQVR